LLPPENIRNLFRDLVFQSYDFNYLNGNNILCLMSDDILFVHVVYLIEKLQLNAPFPPLFVDVIPHIESLSTTFLIQITVVEDKYGNLLL